MQQDKELRGDVAGRGKAGSSLVPDWVWGLVKAVWDASWLADAGLVCCSEVEFLGLIGNGNKRFSLYYISVQIDIYTTQTYILSTDYVLLIWITLIDIVLEYFLYPLLLFWFFVQVVNLVIYDSLFIRCVLIPDFGTFMSSSTFLISLPQPNPWTAECCIVGPLWVTRCLFTPVISCWVTRKKKSVIYILACNSTAWHLSSKPTHTLLAHIWLEKEVGPPCWA